MQWAYQHCPCFLAAKESVEMFMVMFKVYKPLCLTNYFYLGSEEEREHFYNGAILEG